MLGVSSTATMAVEIAILVAKTITIRSTRAILIFLLNGRIILRLHILEIFSSCT